MEKGWCSGQLRPPGSQDAHDAVVAAVGGANTNSEGRMTNPEAMCPM